MKKISLLLIFLLVAFACAGGFRDSVVVKRWTAGARCNHHLTYLAIDYPVDGPSSVIEPIREAGKTCKTSVAKLCLHNFITE